MTLAVQIMERKPTHPSTSARCEMARTSRKIKALACGNRRSKKTTAMRWPSSEEPNRYPAAETSRKR